MKLLTLAFRELLNARRFSLFFILNLCFGIFGFVGLEVFRASVDSALSKNSQNILGADINISGRRDLTAEEQSQLELLTKDYQKTQLFEIYSMVVAEQGTRLAQLRGIDENFPFYGQFVIEDLNGVRHAYGRDLGENEVWVYREFLPQLGVRLGDEITIGKSRYKVTSTIVDDVGGMWSSFNLAPRVYMKREALIKEGLISEGSLVTYNTLFKIEEALETESVAKQMSAVLKDPGIRVVTHIRASQQSGRFLEYFSDYLGLIALLSLLLSSVGTVFLVKHFLQKKLKEVSIMVALGLDIKKAQVLSAFQIMFLGLVASVLVLLFTPLVFPLLVQVLGSVSTLQISLLMPLPLILMTLAIGSLIGPLVCLPWLMGLQKLSVQDLFQESIGKDIRFQVSSLIYYLPALLCYYLLCVYQAHSLVVGSSFFFGVIATGLIMFGLGWFILNIMNFRVKNVGPLMSLRALSRQKQATMSAYLSLAFGAIILCVIPQMKASLQSEIRSPEKSLIPNLFLVDIQEEQVQELTDLLNTESKNLSFLSPMIRARLESINGVKFEKSDVNDSRFFREDEQSDRSRNRSYNLSYRETLSEAEEIVEGRAYPPKYSGNGLPEISVEERFAGRLGVKLGDRLNFDVQGVFIEGVITSLRRVKWTSFQPNFFVQFQEGVLNEAPKTFLASISQLTVEERYRVQNLLVKNFSNISIIDISRIVEKLLEIINLISLVLTAMAVLSLVTGLVVLTSIAMTQVQSRLSEMVLFKVLGASNSQMRNVFVWEAVFLSVAAGLTGIVLGLVFSYIVSTFLFDGVWVVETWSLLTVFCALVLITTGVVAISTQLTIRKEKTL